MRKWFRILLSLFLVFTVIGTYLSPIAQAADSVIPFKFTGVIAGETYGVALTLDTNISFSDYGVADDMSQLAWSYPSVGSAESNSVKEVPTYPWNGSWVYFSEIFSGINNPSYFKIDAGTEFAWGGKTFRLTEDFTITKDGSGWSVYTQPPAGPTYTDVTVQGIVLQTQDFIYLNLGLTNGNANYVTESVTVTNGTSAEQKISAIALEGGNLFIPWTATEGDILKIAKDGTAVDSGGAAGLRFQEEYLLKYNGTEWEPYVAPGPSQPPVEPPVEPTYTDVTVEGIVLQTQDFVYLNIGLPSGNANYVTESVTVTHGAGGETKIPAIALEGGNLFIPWTATNGDILKIAKDGTAVDTGQAIGLRFQEEYLLKFNGTQWEPYVVPGPSQPPVEPTYTDVAVEGIVLQTQDFVYLNIGLTGGNANYSTEAVAVTRATGGETKIPAIALEGGNLFIPWTATNGDILKIAKDGTAVDSRQAVGLRFKKEFILQFNGTQWETYVDPNASAKYSYVDVNVSDIYVQGGHDLYLTTGIADTHKYKNVSFSTTDIMVYKPNGTTDKITNIYMHPDSGMLFVAFSYPVEEGLGIRIPKGGTAVNVAKECGIKFTNNFAMFYSNGAWRVDVESPVITYRAEPLIAGNLYGLRLGMTQKEVEALFAASDAIQGKKDVVFTYPADMFGADGKLQKGTYKMTVSASDNSGNVAKHTIQVKGYSKDAPTITFKGAAEREFDAGKKFDTASLKAVAKDGNGKALSVKFSYSKGALDKKGALKQGVHKLYLTATDDEGQSFTKAITLNCYVFTNVKVTGFYYFLNDELYLSTNMKEPTLFNGARMTSDNLLINGKSGAISWVGVDPNSGSLYVICSRTAGDIMTIAEGATFVDQQKFIGIRVENNFKAHTDGIGWIMDRIPRGRVSGSTGSTGAPATGDTTPWPLYAVACVIAGGMMVVVQKKKKQS